MVIQQYAFIADLMFTSVAMWGALHYLRVWWAYIIAGEMATTLGLSVLFGIFGVQELGWEDTGWFFVYSSMQGVALLTLLFSLTRTYFLGTYAVAGICALVLGIMVGHTHDYMGLGYVAIVVLFGGTKIGLMAFYWRSVRGVWCDSRYDRLHIWQD